MNGKDLKFILPIMVVIVIILAILGVALMSGPKDDEPEDEKGPYEMNVGPITDENNNPIEGAIITIKNKDGNIGTAVTDKDGYAKFSFDSALEDGDYTIIISKYDFEDKELNITFETEDSTIKISGLDDNGNLTLPPEKVPPVEFTVGPIIGPNGTLVGVDVELKHNNETVANTTTDEDGMATFTFETPPISGLYEIFISIEGFKNISIEITLLFNEDSDTLTIIGEVSEITVEPLIPPEPPKHPEPPEPVDDPDYYQELDAYKEFEGLHGAPVDVEGELDQDSNGEPEYFMDIESKTSGKDVKIEDYISFDAEGEPEYSPEIVNYEPIDAQPYLVNKTRSTRSADASKSEARAEEKNITRYDDFINQNEIINDGTAVIMNYETNAVNPTMASEFSKEISQVGVLINNSLAVGFINGTNSTDKNNDSNPERNVTWKIVYLLKDRNGDNKTDKKIVAVQILAGWDNNSNGVYEKGWGFQGAIIALDDDYNGTFENIKYAIAIGAEAKIDGNFTQHYKKVALFYNHTIDKNNDSNFEFQRAALYIQQYFDNNSNGFYELQREFAGGFEGIDNNSNGVWEKELWVWAGKELKDKNDDGNVDQNRSLVWIFYSKDQNEDNNYEEQALLAIFHENFDNNSNGNIEDSKEIIAGFRLIDKNSDGKLEKKDAALAIKRECDRNDDGTMDANAAFGHVFLWRDKNGDKKPELQWALYYFDANYDNNSNGNFEDTGKLIIGFYLVDNNSDGNLNEIYAVYYGVCAKDKNDNGVMDHNASFAYLLHLKDSDDDKIIEVKHAVFGYENKWDNNTDGKFEAVNQFLAGYEGLDNDDDGNVDEEKFFILINLTRDSNNDGNPELAKIGIYAAHKKYNASGNITYARNVLHLTVAWDNNSNGYFEKVDSIVFGHEGFNGTQNGTKMDWQKENIILIYHKMLDNDDNGSWDDHVHVVVKNSR